MLWALRNYAIADYAEFLPYVCSADDDVREAAQVLFMEGGDAVVSALVEALSDPKPGIRAAAANSLGKIGGPAAKEALISASQVKNPILAGIIKNALSELEKREKSA